MRPVVVDGDALARHAELADREGLEPVSDGDDAVCGAIHDPLDSLSEAGLPRRPAGVEFGESTRVEVLTPQDRGETAASQGAPHARPGQHRGGGDEWGRDGDHDIRPTPSCRDRTEPERGLHEDAGEADSTRGHDMTYSRHRHPVDDLVPAKSPEPRVVAPLRVVRDAGEHMRLVTGREKTAGQSGDVRRDTGGLRIIVDGDE